jgi:hypothetical protein
MNFITDHLGAFSARNVTLIVSRGTLLAATIYTYSHSAASTVA